MSFAIKRLVGFWFLVALTIIISFPLVEKQYGWSFSPGSDGNIETIKEFYRFMEHPRGAVPFSELRSTRTYLNGPFIFTAAAAHFVHFLIRIGILPDSILSNSDSLFIFTFRYINVLFFALAAGLAFLCVNYFLKNSLLSFLLCIGSFVLSNENFEMKFMQVDFYLLFSSLFFLYALLLLLQYPDLKRYYLLTGITFVLCAATKLNTPIYLNIPGLGLTLFFIRKHLNRENLTLLFVTVLLTAIIFFYSWFAHPALVPVYFLNIFSEGKSWFTMAERAEFYYFHFTTLLNIYLFKDGYPHWLIGFVISITVVYVLSVLIAFLYIIYQQRYRIIPQQVVLLFIFIIYSAGIMNGPKFVQYGFLVPFFYLISIGFTLAELSQKKRLKWFYGLSLFWVILPLVFNSCYYVLRLKEFNDAQIAFAEVKLVPRKWILDHVKRNSKIAITDSYFSPPLTDEHFDFSPQFLKVPWGEPDKIMSQIPPERDSVQVLTDVILLSNENLQRNIYIEPLVRNKYNLKEDSVKFLTYVAHLQSIFPDIRNKLSTSSDITFCEASFIKSILSAMWAQNLNLEQSLKLYFHSMVSEDKVDTIVDLTITDLFAGNKNILLYHYSEFINSQGRMFVAYAWEQFYSDLQNSFEYKHFESPFEFYSVKWQNVIIVNQDCLIFKNKTFING